MVLIGFTGPMRSGKTLLASGKALDEARKGRRLYANYGLRGALPLDVDMIANASKDPAADEVFRGAVIVIDEIHVWMDSRTPANKLNRAMSWFLTQSGKLDTMIIWTTQFLRQADVRLRMNTQIVYAVERWAWNPRRKWYKPRQDDTKDPFVIRWTKKELTDTRYGLLYVPVLTGVEEHPRRLFSIYDTTERVLEKPQTEAARQGIKDA